MTETIVTKANIKDENGKVISTRTVETERPEILRTDVSLQYLVDRLGERHCIKDVQDQEIVKFRSQIRNWLTQVDDNGDYKYSIEEVQSKQYFDWISEMQQKKSTEEKVAEQMQKMDPDAVKAALAKAGIEI